MATVVARKRKSGVKYTAQIRLMIDGVLHTESKTFDKKAVAKEWAFRREESLQNDPAHRHRGVTVGNLIDQYVAERDVIDALGRSKAAHIKMLRSMPIAELGAMELTTQQIVSHVRDRRLAGTGASTVSNDLIWLRVIFRYARIALGVPVNLTALEDAALIARSERLTGRSNRRKRRPTGDELTMIGNWFRRPNPRGTSRAAMYLLMWFAIYSCRRLGEICSLRLDDFDRDHGIWLVRDVKNPGGSSGNDLEMVVPDRLVPVIDAVIKYIPRDDNRLFPFNEKSLSLYWTRTMQTLGVDDLHFHDLRHEGCSRLAEDGLSIPEIQQVSLHESWGSLQIYVNMRKRLVERVEFDQGYTPISR